jgi:ribosomal-protein-alanine N-acetyltransferase
MLAHEFHRVDQTNLSELIQLHERCQMSPWSDAQLSESLVEPYFTRLIIWQGKPVGYMIAQLVADEMTLMDIGVLPEYRGQGLGKALIDHLAEQSQKRGVRTLWLEVRVSNTAALAFYNAKGFEQISIRKGYYPLAEGREDALVMRLTF